jgi:ribosomal protein S18 acetylase RimI-like enzyme
MRPEDVVIRRAERTDLDSLVPLFDAYRQFYAQAPDAELARDFLGDRMQSGESVVFVAEADGAAVGFTQLYPFPSSVRAAAQFVLNDLYVCPDARGKGIATALLETARDFAREAGAARLLLETAEDNPAQKLYERLGYVRETGFLHYALEL